MYGPIVAHQLGSRRQPRPTGLSRDHCDVSAVAAQAVQAAKKVSFITVRHQGLRHPLDFALAPTLGRCPSQTSWSTTVVVVDPPPQAVIDRIDEGHRYGGSNPTLDVSESYRIQMQD